MAYPAADGRCACPPAYADAAADVLAAYPDKTNWRRHVGRQPHLLSRNGRIQPQPFHLPLDAERAEEPGLRGAVAAQPTAAVLAAGAGRQRHRSATSPPTALKTDFRAVLREVEPALGRPARQRRQRPGRRVRRLDLDQRAAFRAGRLPHAGAARSGAAAVRFPLRCRPRLRRRLRPHPRPRPARGRSWSGWPTTAIRRPQAGRRPAAGPRPAHRGRPGCVGRLLETQHGHELAAAVHPQAFRRPRPDAGMVRGSTLFAETPAAFQFVQKLLLPDSIRGRSSAPAFPGLIDADRRPRRRRSGARVAEFALAELARFDLNALDADFLRRLLVCPLTWNQAAAWVHEGRLKAQTLGLDFLEGAGLHPAWEADARWRSAKQSGKSLDAPTGVRRKPIRAGAGLAGRRLAGFRPPTWASTGCWAGDRSEPRYHNFAVETMIMRSFTAGRLRTATMPPR